MARLVQTAAAAAGLPPLQDMWGDLKHAALAIVNSILFAFQQNSLFAGPDRHILMCSTVEEMMMAREACCRSEHNSVPT